MQLFCTKNYYLGDGPQDRSERGFTLIEILVGIAVFTLITSVIVSAFLSTIRVQRKSIQVQNVIDNSRFVLEKMSRAVRQSTVENLNGLATELNLCHPVLGYPSSSPLCGCSVGNCLDYRFNAGTDRIEERTSLIDDFVSITASNVFVENLNFLVSGSGTGDETQPRVTILMTVRQALTATKPEEETEVHLQTTITPRRLDIIP